MPPRDLSVFAAQYTFEPPSTQGSLSPAIWADLGVALVDWERVR
jgi:hypothetical protein